jgi:hypothetical protein
MARRIVWLAAAWLLTGCSGGPPDSPDVMPDGHGLLTRDHSPRARGGAGNGIIYHGGPVMLPTKNVYLIWWGQWADAASRAIVESFAAHVGGSRWFNINNSYYDGSGSRVENSVTVAASVTDSSLPISSTISDDDVTNEVSHLIATGALPPDANGFYAVLTPADVANSSGFCTQWCGWHASQLVDGTSVKYAYVPDGARCPSACSAFAPEGPTPNGDLGGDAMVNVLAHELSEASTDPELDAWYDHRGAENADKCVWSFGATFAAPDGAPANVRLGGSDYLLQQNWVNASGGYCALAYP